MKSYCHRCGMPLLRGTCTEECELAKCEQRIKDSIANEEEIDRRRIMLDDDRMRAGEREDARKR